MLYSKVSEPWSILYLLHDKLCLSSKATYSKPIMLVNIYNNLMISFIVKNNHNIKILTSNI
jgi:hypothetical protein